MTKPLEIVIRHHVMPEYQFAHRLVATVEGIDYDRIYEDDCGLSNKEMEYFFREWVMQQHFLKANE